MSKPNKSKSTLDSGRVDIPYAISILPFEEYTLETVRVIVNSRSTLDNQRAILFFNGDHWQGQDGWIGPLLNADDALFEDTTQVIEKAFVSQNVVGELVSRHVNGVLGRELHWKFVTKRDIPPVTEKTPTGTVTKPDEPKPQEQALIDEAQTALETWWNERNILETLKNALAGLLLIRRAPLRLSIPPDLRDENGLLPQVDLAGALDMLYLDHMGFDDDSGDQILPSATVYTRKNNRRMIALFYYKEGPEERAELCYVNKEGKTILRILSKKSAEDQPQELALDLGKRILMHEMARKELISPQIMSRQRSFNKTLTMKDRNDTQGGFLERYLLNVRWPTETKTVTKADGSIEVTETPKTMITGAGAVNALAGETFVDEAGVSHVLNPSVVFRDPVPALTFIDSGDHTYLGMLQEANQIHYAQKDLAVSGESRKQSRESYTKDLENSGNGVEGTVRWILETALALASLLAGQPNRFDSLRAFVQCHIDPGPVGPDDIRVAAEMKERGMWDREYAISQTGADDVSGIIQRLDSEESENNARALALQEQQLKVENDNQPPDNEDDGA